MKNAGLSSVVIAVILLAVGAIAEAQQQKKIFRGLAIYRIKHCLRNDSPLGHVPARALMQAWIDRRKEYRHRVSISLSKETSGCLSLRRSLVRLKVDLIVTSSSDIGVRAVKNATKTIPIVMTSSGWIPWSAGLIAKPGAARKVISPGSQI